MRWVLERGGDGVRTGLEDNIRITKDRLANSNAELVQVAVEPLRRIRRPPRHPRGSPVDAGLGGLRQSGRQVADRQARRA